MHRTRDLGTTNLMEGAPAANKLFVPEHTIKSNTGIKYSRLIHRRCASLDLETAFKHITISAIQAKVYHMLKCHLSVINHPSITQFDDISLANHDFDRVVGPDFHNISGTESRPDLSLQTDFNETYYSVFSQAQRQVYRVTERSFKKTS